MSILRSKTKRRQGETPAKSMPIRRRRRWIKFVARSISLLTIGLIAAHWYWGRSAEHALDDQIRSYAAAGEPIYPADLNDPPVPDAENAVIELRLAAQHLYGSSEQWLNFAQVIPGPPLSSEHLKTIDAVMEGNGPALEHLAAATTKPSADWRMTFASPVLDVKNEESPRVLHLSTLLRAAALAAHAKGEYGQSLERVRQMLALARIVDRQRKLSAHVTAASIVALAAKTASEIAPDVRLSTPSARPRSDLIRQLMDDAPLREGQLRDFWMMRVMFWDSAKAIAGGRDDLLPGHGGGITGGRLGSYAIKPLLMNDGLWLVQYMSKIIHSAKFSADWPEFCQNAPLASMELQLNPRAHLIANRLLPDLPRYVRGQYRAITECRLAAVALAIGWYAQDHGGAMPASLEDLKPAYLPYIPFDPMAGGGKPLRLGGTPEQRAIYSVGDDGVDDGGSDVPSNPRLAQSAGSWDRRDFVVRLTRRAATTKPATQAAKP